jgi:hypothetical protein
VNEPNQIPLDEIRIDPSNLYREETFTDLKVGSLRQLTPVTPEGDRDLSRPMVYVAQTQLMSQYGPVPVQAEIDAANLGEAMAAFPDAIRTAVDQLMDEARELRRQEMSRIVMPSADAASKILK